MSKANVLKKISATIFLPLLLSGSFAWAWPPTYGAEFEVLSPLLQDPNAMFNQAKAYESNEKKEQMRYITHMRERCVTIGCKVTEVPGKWDTDYKVEFPDGWWFKVSYDPGCVEITFKASTLETLQAKSDLINDALFKTARDLNMQTPEYGINHFNMGIRSTFNDSGKEFLKFFVDYANHPDLALGGLGSDIMNAPPLSVLGEDQRMALQVVIDDFNAGKLATIQQIARAIQDRVYIRSYNPDWGGANHYQAFGLKHVNGADLTKSDAPFEFRAMWSQDSVEAFTKIVRLMEARVKFLENSKEPLLYTASTRTQFINEGVKTRFFLYVEETGLKFDEFKDLLRSSVRSAPLGAFLIPEASIDDKLQSIEDYWDLTLTSALARKMFVKIIRSPEAQGRPLTTKLRDRLEKEFAQTSALKTDAQSVAKAQILQTLVDQMHGKVNSCEMVFSL
jgi:hypothetical protein